MHTKDDYAIDNFHTHFLIWFPISFLVLRQRGFRWNIQISHTAPDVVVSNPMFWTNKSQFSLLFNDSSAFELVNFLINLFGNSVSETSVITSLNVCEMAKWSEQFWIEILLWNFCLQQLVYWHYLTMLVNFVAVVLCLVDATFLIKT